MRKAILVLLALAFLPASVLAQRNIDWEKVQVKTQKLDDMVKMLAVLKDTRAVVQAGIDRGKSLEQLKQEKAFAKWDYLNESHHIQSDVYFQRLYKTQSAKKNPAASQNRSN